MMYQAGVAFAGTPSTFKTRHIRIKPDFSVDEERAMVLLAEEFKNRLAAVAPETPPGRLEQVSQWGTQVMGTIVNLNNRLKVEKPLQVLIRHIEEWFADCLGIPMKDHSLSVQEETFLQLLPQIAQRENAPTAQTAVKSLFKLYDAEKAETEAVQ